MTRYVAAVAVLTLVYALALASFDPLDLLFGAALSAALVFVSRGFVFGDDPDRGPSLLRRAAALLPFSFDILRDIVVSTSEV